VDGVDDLGVVNAAEVDRGDREVGVSELALDHEQRNSLARHLNRVGVPELVTREPPPHTSLRCGLVHPSWSEKRGNST
jgi:hypothetical protein